MAELHRERNKQQRQREQQQQHPAVNCITFRMERNDNIMRCTGFTFINRGHNVIKWDYNENENNNNNNICLTFSNKLYYLSLSEDLQRVSSRVIVNEMSLFLQLVLDPIVN